jgi:hypothetical protein
MTYTSSTFTRFHNTPEEVTKSETDGQIVAGRPAYRYWLTRQAMALVYTPARIK